MICLNANEIWEHQVNSTNYPKCYFLYLSLGFRGGGVPEAEKLKLLTPSMFIICRALPSCCDPQALTSSEVPGPQALSHGLLIHLHGTRGTKEAERMWRETDARVANDLHAHGQT